MKAKHCFHILNIYSVRKTECTETSCTFSIGKFHASTFEVTVGITRLLYFQLQAKMKSINTANLSHTMI